MMDLIYAMPVLAIGLVIAVIALPWKDTHGRSISTIEYWIVWAVFWWAILPYLIVHAARWYIDRWSHYMARKRYERSKQ